MCLANQCNAAEIYFIIDAADTQFYDNVFRPSMSAVLTSFAYKKLTESKRIKVHKSLSTS